jgi:hypothetical protein
MLRSLLVAAAFALTCAAPAAARQSEAPVSLLFAQSATHGSLAPTACRCGDRRVLTLRGAARQSTWFQDRPERHAGQLPAGVLARHWAAFGFQGDAPNAALTLLGGSDDADTVVVELVDRPRYDVERHTLRFVVRLLHAKASGGLADFDARQDARIPRRFGAASLFIDAASVRQRTARDLGAGRWSKELELPSSSPAPASLT